MGFEMADIVLPVSLKKLTEFMLQILLSHRGQQFLDLIAFFIVICDYIEPKITLTGGYY